MYTESQMVSTLTAALIPSADSAPAGGAALDQVAIASVMALALGGFVVWLGAGHRSGRVRYLGRAAAWSERITGLPGWAALPSLVSAASLLVALLGMYWDISFHIDAGRDPGPLANPAHYLILFGLFGIFTAGYFAVSLPEGRPGPAAVHLVGNWYAPIGGLLIAICGAFGLLGFPLDDLWHRLFGQDVTLWGPTHLMMIGGAGMTLIGQAVLLAEGMAARPPETRLTDPPLAARLRRTALMGGLLLGLSTFQGEFDFGVPQFRFVLEPALLAIAASIALVCARLWIGRGGALMAAGMFIAIRGGIALIVYQGFGQSLPHFPLYLAEALCVELAALVLARRPLALGAVAGLLIGTVGFVAEWGWSLVAMPLPWTSDLFPEGLVLAMVSALAGGLVGALMACALRGELPSVRVTRAIPAAALVAILAVFADGLWTTTPQNVQAHVRLHQLQPGPDREVAATVRMDPADAASSPAWLTATAWQGGGLVVDRLRSEGNGVYRTTEPIPVWGDWKATIRLQNGREVLGMPIYMPTDPEIPWAKPVAAKPQFSRSFVFDHKLLQREQKPDVPTWLKTVAPLIVLAIALTFLSLLAWGLGRIGRATARARPPTAPRRSQGRRPVPAPVPTGARS
ncbi:MAG: hypothetical protein ACJ75I_11795 [Solirubrobacterales bacterium]